MGLFPGCIKPDKRRDSAFDCVLGDNTKAYRDDTGQEKRFYPSAEKEKEILGRMYLYKRKKNVQPVTVLTILQ